WGRPVVLVRPVAGEMDPHFGHGERALVSHARSPCRRSSARGGGIYRALPVGHPPRHRSVHPRARLVSFGGSGSLASFVSSSASAGRRKRLLWWLLQHALYVSVRPARLSDKHP